MLHSQLRWLYFVEQPLEERPVLLELGRQVFQVLYRWLINHRWENGCIELQVVWQSQQE